MRPIPRKMLIHTISHRTAKSTDAWGGDTWASAQTVRHVRVEPTDKVVFARDNREKQLSLLLFHDCRNSLPATETYALEDSVLFASKEYTVQTVDDIYDNHGLHHYEVGLI